MCSERVVPTLTRCLRLFRAVDFVARRLPMELIPRRSNLAVRTRLRTLVESRGVVRNRRELYLLNGRKQTLFLYSKKVQETSR